MTELWSSQIPPYNFSSVSFDFTIFTPIEILALLTLVTLLSIVGTTGNLLVIISIFNQDFNLSVTDNPTNLLLLSQAVADLLVSCASGPAYDYTLYVPKASFVSASLGQLTGAASVGNLVLLTLNRFVSIHSPLKYSRFVTPSRTKVAIVLSWTISLMFGILAVVGYRLNIRQITETAKFYMIPSFFVIAGCYVYMYIKARYHKKQIKRMSYQPTGHQAGLEKDLKSLFSLLLVSGTFFLTWVPFTIFTFVLDPEEDPIRYSRILLFLLPLIILNSALDPIIYYFRSTKFRQVLRRLERRHRERRIRRSQQKWQRPIVMYRKTANQISCQGASVDGIEENDGYEHSA